MFGDVERGGTVTVCQSKVGARRSGSCFGFTGCVCKGGSVISDQDHFQTWNLQIQRGGKQPSILVRGRISLPPCIAGSFQPLYHALLSFEGSDVVRYKGCAFLEVQGALSSLPSVAQQGSQFRRDHLSGQTPRRHSTQASWRGTLGKSDEGERQASLKTFREYCQGTFGTDQERTRLDIHGSVQALHWIGTYQSILYDIPYPLRLTVSDQDMTTNRQN